MHIQYMATEVVKKLHEHGFIAYFAGGFVRDLLLNIHSADIDIATDALPEEISKIFPEHALVGAQFGVCLIRHKGHQFEVATFRQDVLYEDGRRPTSVVLKSTPEEDAKRRDFTINGMFFDPINHQILDFVGGTDDLKAKCVRTIGSPLERFKEDRLRMVRAVRFEINFDFQLEEETIGAIKKFAHTLLPAVSMERIWQEICKMRKNPRFCSALLRMAELHLLAAIFPPLKTVGVSTIRDRLSSLESLSDKVPAILILMQLFSSSDLPFILGLGVYLRASKEETKWIELFLETTALWQNDPSLSQCYEWAHLLANNRSKVCLEVLFAKLTEQEREKNFHTINAFSSEYAAHIERIHKRHPICRAKDLEPLGIRPSKRMGELLRIAERIAIEANIHDPHTILLKLQQDPLWFKTIEEFHS